MATCTNLGSVDQIKCIIGSGKNNKRNDSQIMVIDGSKRLCRWPCVQCERIIKIYKVLFFPLIIMTHRAASV